MPDLISGVQGLHLGTLFRRHRLEWLAQPGKWALKIKIATVASEIFVLSFTTDIVKVLGV